MKTFPSSDHISPVEFELLVKEWLEEGANGLESFTAAHLERLQGMDGEYNIDVSAEFRIFDGARIRVIVECKKHINPIKRELVQVLRDKQLSLGANKAILVSTSSFQSGAIEYAATHGIALIQVVSGAVRYIQASAMRSSTGTKSEVEHPEHQLQAQMQAEPFVGLFYGKNPHGDLIFPQLLARNFAFEFERYLHG